MEDRPMAPRPLTSFVCPLLTRIKDNGEIIYVYCLGDKCISFREGTYKEGCMIFKTECEKVKDA